MEEINKIINRVANRRNLTKICDSSYVCYLFNQTFKELKAVAFKAGNLYLETNDSFESQEIYLKQVQIIEKINQRLGKEIVKKIKFRTIN